jgi:RNA polymerase sigma-70 factor (ECF subfamily)
VEPNTAFRDLLGRVRAGDAAAAAELVRQFEPAVRRAVRLRLTDPRYFRLQRILDSVDISQSILGNFFVRAALGQFELETPAQLVRLLVTMAYNKLTDQARKPANRQPLLSGADCPELAADSGSAPSEVVAGRELVQQFLQRLSPGERRLANLRAAGRSWDEVASEVGGTPAAVRKQLE